MVEHLRFANLEPGRVAGSAVAVIVAGRDLSFRERVRASGRSSTDPQVGKFQKQGTAHETVRTCNARHARTKPGGN